MKKKDRKAAKNSANVHGAFRRNLQARQEEGRAAYVLPSVGLALAGASSCPCQRADFCKQTSGALQDDFSLESKATAERASLALENCHRPHPGDGFIPSFSVGHRCTWEHGREKVLRWSPS